MLSVACPHVLYPFSLGAEGCCVKPLCCAVSDFHVAFETVMIAIVEIYNTRLWNLAGAVLLEWSKAALRCRTVEGCCES